MSDKGTAVFGLFDGMTSVLGMVLALALFGTLRGLIVATVAGAVGAGASMAAGEWLADNDQSPHKALIMGLATLIGCMAPAVPFYLTQHWVAYAACGVLVVALGCVIAHLRPEKAPRSYIQTFAVLAIATALAVGAAAVS